MSRLPILLMGLLTLLISCQRTVESGVEADGVQNRIDSLEKIIFDDPTAKTDPKTGMHLIREYARFYQHGTKDSLSVDMLFKAGELSMGVGQGNLAVKYFKTIHKQHADFYKAPEALFLIGFCQENLNGDTTEARFYYQKFLESHPQHRLADDARFSVQNLGKSDEELIRMFEERMK